MTARMTRRAVGAVVALMVAFTIPVAEAQSGAVEGFKERLKRRASERVSEAVADVVARRTAEQVGKAVDKVTEPGADGEGVAESDAGAAGQAGDAGGSGPAAQPSTAAASGSAEGSSAPAAAPGAAASAPGTGVWANYDFVPGSSVLFVEDFTSERVGNFPRRLEFENGMMEVVEWQGRRLLRATGRESRFAIPLPTALPERFTVEIDFYDSYGSDGLSISTSQPTTTSSTWPAYYDLSYISLGHRHGSGLRTRQGKGPVSVAKDDRTKEGLLTARVSFDGSYVKVYLDERRVANVPNAILERGDKLWITTGFADEERPTYIGEVRVAAGGRELYEDLAADGRATTRGILFDLGGAALRPESTPVLEEIAAMLRDHPELSLRIEGHTDSTGDPDRNFELSGRRAEAVRDFLIASHQIQGDRLEAVGFGADRPVGDNATPEGRQTNRRVELVRLPAAGDSDAERRTR